MLINIFESLRKVKVELTGGFAIAFILYGLYGFFILVKSVIELIKR